MSANRCNYSNLKSIHKFHMFLYQLKSTKRNKERGIRQES